jgi:L-amino acid N-acyltransferase YncA
MKLQKVQAGSDLEADFLSLPAVLFPDNIPLQMESLSWNQEHLLHGYLLQKKGEYIGRIALYHHPGHRVEGEAATCVGYFHCINEQEAAQTLIDAAAADTRALGIGKMIGPLNGSTWESYRFRTSDDPPPFFLENANPAYYNDLFLACGFEPLKTYYSFEVKPLEPMSERAQKREQHFKETGISFREMDPEHYEEDVRKIYALSLECFKDNFLYTPYPIEAFAKKYRLLEDIFDPSMTLLAEEDGQLVGFVFMIDDAFCTTEKRVVFKTYAVHPHRKYAGLGAVLSQRLIEQLLQKGYTSSIHALVIEGSISFNISSANSKVYRTYQLYIRNL